MTIQNENSNQILNNKNDYKGCNIMPQNNDIPIVQTPTTTGRHLSPAYILHLDITPLRPDAKERLYRIGMRWGKVNPDNYVFERHLKGEVVDILSEYGIGYGLEECRDEFPETDEAKREMGLETVRNIEIMKNYKKTGVIEDTKKSLEIKKRLEKGSSTEQLDPQGIYLSESEIYKVIDATEELLNGSDFFQRAGSIVTLGRAPEEKKKNMHRAENATIIKKVEPLYIAEVCTQKGKYYKYNAKVKGWQPTGCPEKIARHLVSRPSSRLPYLTGLIYAPTLRSDGSILQTPGYDEETGIFFVNDGVDFNAIKEHPTKEDAEEALKKILFILKDFPFEDGASLSVALSAILTSLIRKSMRAAPIHAYTAPKMRSGKSLLTNIVGQISTGKSNTVINHMSNEIEMKKLVVSALREGDPIISIDNIEVPFGGSYLCSMVTEPIYKDRILGVSETVSIPTQVLFLANGNNLRFAGDLSTRAVLCKIDPDVERPEERPFEVDLEKYVPQHRVELLSAGLTILRAYHVADRPSQPIKPYGRFEDWSNWVRASLVWLGLEDPCKTRADIENDDPVRLALIALFTAWNKLPVTSTTSGQLIKMSQKDEELADALELFAGDERGAVNARRLGKMLSSMKNRIEGGFKIVWCCKYQGADTWKLVKIDK